MCVCVCVCLFVNIVCYIYISNKKEHNLSWQLHIVGTLIHESAAINLCLSSYNISPFLTKLIFKEWEILIHKKEDSFGNLIGVIYPNKNKFITETKFTMQRRKTW